MKKSMSTTGTLAYLLNPNFDKRSLSKLLNHFESEVRREQDKALAISLRRELLDSPDPAISISSLARLARWCKTDGIYSDGMEIARKISQLLFGCNVDRDKLGT
ncbi:MAG: hypothetical protein JWN45_2669 [Acidobacteriaceae bacterium]|nr:hypothetical protein [Acidobacteriaceae bacterium]